MLNLTRGTVILTSPQQIFLRPQPIFCESFRSVNMNDLQNWKSNRFFFFFRWNLWWNAWNNVHAFQYMQFYFNIRIDIVYVYCWEQIKSQQPIWGEERTQLWDIIQIKKRIEEKFM